MFSDNLFLNGQLGLDWEINDHTTLGLLSGYTRSTNQSDNNSSSSAFYINDELDGTTGYESSLENQSQNNFINLNLFRKITDQSTLNLDMDRIELQVENTSFLEDNDPNRKYRPSSQSRA